MSDEKKRMWQMVAVSLLSFAVGMADGIYSCIQKLTRIRER